jgi:hypothetical protein
MSIKKEIIAGIDPANNYKLAIDNGDLQAIKEVIEKYNFIDEQAALRFALFALLKAEKNVIYVDEGEKKVMLTPSATVVKPPRSDEQKD